jgi:hypothetical protein
MDSRKYVLKETLYIAAGEAVCVAAMIGIFALLGQYSREVLLGGIVGGLVAVANFFFMAVGVTLAADKAENQEVNAGKALVSSSYTIRLVLMAVVLFAAAKSGYCNVFALVIPLVFVRPVLTLGEFFRKSGEKQV